MAPLAAAGGTPPNPTPNLTHNAKMILFKGVKDTLGNIWFVLNEVSYDIPGWPGTSSCTPASPSQVLELNPGWF